jgi:hypothetical protein
MSEFKVFPQNAKELTQALSLHKPLHAVCTDPMEATKTTGFDPEHIQYFYEKIGRMCKFSADEYKNL